MRVAGLFSAGLLVFLVLQAVLVPEGFGVYGHYRAGALEDNQQHEIAFAGRAACIDCHSDVPDQLSEGKHAKVACEACHGALAKHAEDPGAAEARRPDPTTLCLVCHLTNVAKPGWFPQIEPQDHAGDEACVSCHAAHTTAFPEEAS